VAKEFVAARGDERGALVLSKFTGAARELTDAIQVNPFDVEELANGLHSALRMPVEEQESRMRRMRGHVMDHNIYRWAGQLLSAVGRLVPDPLPCPVGVGESRIDGTEQEVVRENLITALRMAAG
jgi:trehalose 6-phosphate synthase